MQVYLIDLDDTLLASSEASRQAMERVIALACEGFPESCAKRLRAAWISVRTQFWGNPERATKGRFDSRWARRTTLQQALTECRLPLSNLDGLLDAYAHWREASLGLAAGAADLLDDLKARGMLVLVTNGTTREQRAKLDRFGLARHFDGIVIEEEARSAKPRLYPVACARLGLNAYRRTAVVIGDDVARDGRGAEILNSPFLHIASAGRCAYCDRSPYATHFWRLSDLADELKSHVQATAAVADVTRTTTGRG
jgi:putative hydrolase of the HAD superfamily